MANSGIGILDRGLEALEEGGRQTVKAVGQQVSLTTKNVATQVTGTDYTAKPQETLRQSSDKASPASSNAPASSAEVQKASDADKQDMLKALYGPTQPQPASSADGQAQPGQPQQSSEQMQTQAKTTEEAELAKTRQRIEQEKLQKHQQQHNEVYFDQLNKPEAKKGQKEESQQEKVEREKAEEEKKKQMELEEKQKKDEKVKAPSKHSAEHERKLGG
jgi:hypothetical protein